MDGKHCPACGQDIGMLAVLRAPLPNIGIRCPHCRARLKYVPGFYFLSALSLLAYVLIVFTLAPTVLGLPYDPNLLLLVAIAVAVLLWQPFEILLTVLLRERATLQLKDAAAPAADAPVRDDAEPSPRDHAEPSPRGDAEPPA